jgi:hypothetical protein
MRGSDLTRLPEEIVRQYDKGGPADEGLIFKPELLDNAVQRETSVVS